LSKRAYASDPGERNSVISGGEDVGEHRAVVLVLVAGRQRETIEAGERDPQVLGLAAAVRSYRDLAVHAAAKPRVYRQAEAGGAGENRNDRRAHQ
jgi:hypothetical protein